MILFLILVIFLFLFNMQIFDSIKRIYEFGVTQWVINWCWQKWKLSFSELFLWLESVPHFIPDKGKICLKEIEYGCWVHDILCEFWGTRTMKLYADLWFSFYVKDRIDWTWFWFRNIFCFGLFIGLHFKWKDAWNFVK